MKLKTNFGGLQVGKPPITQLRWSKLFSTNLVPFTACQCAKKPIFFPIKSCCIFNKKNCRNFGIFFFFVDANSASFSFFWKINLPNFLLQNIEKRNPATRREQTNVSIYFKLLILWPLGCMGAIMQREMAIAGMERLGS